MNDKVGGIHFANGKISRSSSHSKEFNKLNIGWTKLQCLEHSEDTNP